MYVSSSRLSFYFAMVAKPSLSWLSYWPAWMTSSSNLLLSSFYSAEFLTLLTLSQPLYISSGHALPPIRHLHYKWVGWKRRPIQIALTDTQRPWAVQVIPLLLITKETWLDISSFSIVLKMRRKKVWFSLGLHCLIFIMYFAVYHRANVSG